MFDADTVEDFAEAQKRADAVIGKTLLRNALVLQAAHKRNLSRANPPPLHASPAKQGQFPRARTYNLRDAVVVDPPDLATITATKKVTVGVLVNAVYGAILKAKGWLGIEDTHAAVKSSGGYR